MFQEHLSTTSDCQKVSILISWIKDSTRKGIIKKVHPLEQGKSPKVINLSAQMINQKLVDGTKPFQT